MEIYTDHFTSAKVIYPQKLEKIKVWDRYAYCTNGTI